MGDSKGTSLSSRNGRVRPRVGADNRSQGDTRTGKRFVFLHFWPMNGGLNMRCNMLLETLSTFGHVQHIRTGREFLALLRSGELGRAGTSVIILTSLLAPLVIGMKCLWRGLKVCYLVRGDEITWAQQANRNVRAFTARVFQGLLKRIGCRFIFVSWDLEHVFKQRLGPINDCRLMPNTIGEPVPPIRPFDGRVAVVGDFGTVKNIESVIEGLESGSFTVDLYGNSSLPKRYRRPWLKAHGFVEDLSSHLSNLSLVVIPGVSEGFPNVLLDALKAGCSVVVHSGFPFSRLPLSDWWRFDLNAGQDQRAGNDGGAKHGISLEAILHRLLWEPRDFKRDNPELIRVAESDWHRYVVEAFK